MDNTTHADNPKPSAYPSHYPPGYYGGLETLTLPDKSHRSSGGGGGGEKKGLLTRLRSLFSRGHHRQPTTSTTR